MKFHPEIPVYGDTSFRGDCPTETAEQATFFNQLPKELRAIALHIRNEGKRTNNQMARQRAEGGFVKGSADIIIPGCPTFVAELKRKDHTKSKWQDGQVEYLLACKRQGAFVCVSLGWESCMEAVNEWRGLAQT